MVSKPGAGLPNDPRRCSGWSDSSPLIRMTLPASVNPSMLCRSSGSAGRALGAMIGYRLPRRIDDRSRLRETRVVGQVRDPGSETVGDGWLFGLEQIEHLAGVLAFEHTSVDPASKVASRPNANPPIQKNGELQNSLSAAVRSRTALRFRWWLSSAAWVCTTPLGVLVVPDV